MNSPAELLLPEGLASPSEIVWRALIEGLTPDPEITVWEWADQKRILPKETTAEYGPWRTDRVPLMREIMAALSPSDPVQEVILAKGTQLAGTEVGNNFLGYVIDVAPGPAMLVLPTSNTAKRSGKTRIDKMIEATPSLRDKVAEKRSRDASNTASLKEFDGGLLIIAGANSAAELASSPVRYLFLDELDSFPDSLGGEGAPEKLAEKRTDTFVRKKIFKNSSVKGARGRSKIMKNWRRGDQRRAYVPCPHCEHRQPLVWEQMRWDTRKARDLRCTECGGLSEILPAPITGAATPSDDGSSPSSAPAAEARATLAAPLIHTCPHCQAHIAESEDTVLERDTAEVLWVHYECIACAEPIQEHHKPAMFAAGQWVPEQPGAGRPKSYHLSSLYSPLGWYGWLQAVRDFIEAEADPSGEKMRTFMNTVLALEYTDPGQEVEHEGLRTRAEAYRLRSVPMGGLMLSAAVDVQKNRLEVKVKAWGRGEESWLVAYEVIYGDPMQDDVWESLDDFLATSFAHEGGNSMRILATAVDSGFLTQRVYNFCATRGHRLIFPVKGVQSSGKAILGKPSKQDIDWRGQVIKDGIDLWPIGVDSAKSLVLSRLGIEKPGPQYMHFPLGLPDSYYKGLTAERKTRKLIHGYEKWVWEKESGVANEPFDLEGYAYAAAIRAGVTRANWDKLEAFFRGTGDLFVAAAKAEATERKERNTRDPRTGTDAASPDVAPEFDSPDACAAATDGEADAVNAPAVVPANAGTQEAPAAPPAVEPPPPAAPPVAESVPRETPKKPAWIQLRRDWFGRR
jgi:phage terminase large subunit GpA-like protein